jgi:hypothetical protein
MSVLINTVPKFREIFRRIWTRLRCLPVGFLCLSQIFTRASLNERHRTNCFECNLQPSNEGQASVFSIRLFRVHCDRVPIGTGPSNCRGSTLREKHLVEILWTRVRPDAETSTYTTHKTNNRQTLMSSVRFEPATSGSELL